MKNSKPEKHITEPLILAWANRNRIDLTVVDTSTVFNPVSGRYTSRKASESLPDCIGNYGMYSVWIELKAPGYRIASHLSDDQRAFLVRKINQGCFACVTDGPEHIGPLWLRWKSLEKAEDRRAFLLADLPQPRITALKPYPANNARKRRRKNPEG